MNLRRILLSEINKLEGERKMSERQMKPYHDFINLWNTKKKETKSKLSVSDKRMVVTKGNEGIRTRWGILAVGC